MRANPHLRQVNRDWTQRVPTVRYILDQDRLRLIGLSPTEAAQQLQFPVERCPLSRRWREDIRAVDVVARSSGPERLDPARLANFSLTAADGRAIPPIRLAAPRCAWKSRSCGGATALPRSPCAATSMKRFSPPDVSVEVQKALAPIMAKLPAGYQIETAGPIEESTKANAALALVFPVMLLAMLAIIMFQVRSFSTMTMVVLTDRSD